MSCWNVKLRNNTYHYASLVIASGIHACIVNVGHCLSQALNHKQICSTTQKLRIWQLHMGFNFVWLNKICISKQTTRIYFLYSIDKWILWRTGRWKLAYGICFLFTNAAQNRLMISLIAIYVIWDHSHRLLWWFDGSILKWHVTFIEPTLIFTHDLIALNIGFLLGLNCKIMTMNCTNFSSLEYWACVFPDE